MGDLWVETVVDIMAEALRSSDFNLVIMPISDDKYKDQKLWIRNKLELRAKIKNSKGPVHVY